MPKTGTYFDDNLSILCLSDLREKLTALGYMRGETSYSSIARDILIRGVEKRIEVMEPAEARQFKGVLENIHAQTIINRQKRAEKAVRVSTSDPPAD